MSFVSASSLGHGFYTRYLEKPAPSLPVSMPWSGREVDLMDILCQHLPAVLPVCAQHRQPVGQAWQETIHASELRHRGFCARGMVCSSCLLCALPVCAHLNIIMLVIH